MTSKRPTVFREASQAEEGVLKGQRPSGRADEQTGKTVRNVAEKVERNMVGEDGDRQLFFSFGTLIVERFVPRK
jgi:hypothetical protein